MHMSFPGLSPDSWLLTPSLGTGDSSRSQNRAIIIVIQSMTWKDISDQKAHVQLQILKQMFEIQDKDNQWREKVFCFVKKKRFQI